MPIKVTVQVSKEDAEKLFWAVNSGELEKIGVTSAEYLENPTLFTAHTRPGNGEVEYTYAETDHLMTRRHWMTEEQMKEYEATPVTYPTLQMLHEAMLQSWGLRKEDLIVKEVKYEKK